MPRWSHARSFLQDVSIDHRLKRIGLNACFSVGAHLIVHLQELSSGRAYAGRLERSVSGLALSPDGEGDPEGAAEIREREDRRHSI
jgi:hypothetical protein